MNKKRFHLSWSLGYKIIVFLILVVSLVVGVGSAAGILVFAEAGVYTENYRDVVNRVLYSETRAIANVTMSYLEDGDTEGVIGYLKYTNAEVALLQERLSNRIGGDTYIWTSYDKTQYENGDYLTLYNGDDSTCFYQDIYFHSKTNISPLLEELGYSLNEGGVDGTGIQSYDNYAIRVFYNLDFPVSDNLWRHYCYVEEMYEYKEAVIVTLVFSVIIGLISLILLFCAAGHRNGKEGVTPMLTNKIYFDIFTGGIGVIISCIFAVVVEIARGSGMTVFVPSAVCGGFVIVMLLLLWMLDFAVRLKIGKWWRHTLCYVVIRGIWRLVKRFIGFVWYLASGIPMVPIVFCGYAFVNFVEFVLMLGSNRAPQICFWILYKLCLFVIVMYIAVGCSKLLQAGKKLADGEENYRVDTKHLFGKMKDMGNHLNHIGEGITKAVEERMKSERLKTELITNVSHDIKTPLTSIINYTDLLSNLGKGEEQDHEQYIQIERATYEEYTEVLLRQSTRLKKLLENLVEASKANTGNMEVNMIPCEVGVLLTQAVGEYQQRMEDNRLQLIASQPEEEVCIMADGRHLWRVFDNLLGNICKYSQENSRVYVSVETRKDKVDIIFRNMSKYALNISPEELEERFVRGDKSRHIEGNGLGLAIAKSLTELQKGQMQIVVDGDLFKVILTFDRLRDSDPKTEPEVVNGKTEKTDWKKQEPKVELTAVQPAAVQPTVVQPTEEMIQPNEEESKAENLKPGDSEWI